VLRWPAELNHESATVLLPALWARLGSAALDGQDGAGGGCVAFTWQDGLTRAQLRLPFDEKPPELIVVDARGPDALDQRARAARQNDQADRLARLKEKKPAVRLARSPGEVNGVSLAGLELGKTRADAEASLELLRPLKRTSIPGGVSLVLGEPPAEAPWWARQLLARFADDRLVEVRLRFVLGPAKLGPKDPTLLTTLGKPGRPQSVKAEWDGLWDDLGVKRTAAVKYRWQDDRTIRTYQADQGGIEVTWRDRPAEKPNGVALAPLKAVPPGPVAGVALGSRQKEVEKALNKPVRSSAGYQVFRAPAGPYESVLIWFEGGKAARIVATHRDRPGTQAVPQALARAWGRDVAGLGYPRRLEGKRGGVLQSYYWHDDTTRVHLFAQTTEQGPRLFTEWRRWPLP
jgi:hypothetical protein